MRPISSARWFSAAVGVTVMCRAVELPWKRPARTLLWCVLVHGVCNTRCTRDTGHGVRAMDGHLTVSYVSRVAVSWLRFTLTADLSSYIIYTSAYEATGERRDA